MPREFVFMDRAAIGLGAVFLHLRAELNFYRLFKEAIEDFSIGQGDEAARSGRPGESQVGRNGVWTPIYGPLMPKSQPHSAVALPRQLR